MATYDEKSAVQQLERVETNSDSASAHVHTQPLEKTETQETLAAIDLENHQAFKGNDSDGKVAWTWQKMLAAAFLSMLYTGEGTRSYLITGTDHVLQDPKCLSTSPVPRFPS